MGGSLLILVFFDAARLVEKALKVRKTAVFAVNSLTLLYARKIPPGQPIAMPGSQLRCRAANCDAGQRIAASAATRIDRFQL
jgi:hypothetical protein